MKESTGSLRAFFIVIGLLGMIGGGLGMLGVLVLLAAKPVWGVLLGACVVINLALSLAYFYCGVKLPELLKTNVGFVLKVLYASLTMTGVGTLVNIVLGLFTVGGLLPTLISVLISIYLINSVKRLSLQREEAADGVGFTPF
ncbi:hypothetical protein JST97_35720 [bacterium]|nr:hypothetical protein [bacterium]